MQFLTFCQFCPFPFLLSGLVLAWHKNTGPVTSVRPGKDRPWPSAWSIRACGAGRRTSRKPAPGQGSSPRRFWFRRQRPRHHVSAGGRGRRQRAGARQAQDPLWSQYRPQKQGLREWCGDRRRGTNGAEIWSHSFSQATHLVCQSTEGTFVQSVRSKGLRLLIHLPRGTPFPSVFACRRAFAKWAQQCVLRSGQLCLGQTSAPSVL